MCGVLLWWNVTPPERIGQATGARLVGLAEQQVALHVVGLAVLEHAVAVAAVDEVHAAVAPRRRRGTASSR